MQTGKLNEIDVFSFVESFSGGAHIKDACTGNYLHTNMPNLSAYDFQRHDELLGLSIKDLNALMTEYWTSEFAKNVKKMDEYVHKTAQPITHTQIKFVDRNGLIHINDMTKLPIFSSGKKVSAILTMSLKSEEYPTRQVLWQYYKSTYKSAKKASYYFMKYLNIHKFFYTTLTEKELMTLCYMIEDRAYKYLAAGMKVSLKTVETHLENIKSKLKNVELLDVVVHLRTTIS